MNVIGNTEKQEVGCWANNRVENSHLPFRRQERAMLRFRRMKSLQTFSAVRDAFHNHFNKDRCAGLCNASSGAYFFAFLNVQRTQRLGQ